MSNLAGNTTNDKRFAAARARHLAACWRVRELSTHTPEQSLTDLGAMLDNFTYHEGIGRGTVRRGQHTDPKLSAVTGDTVAFLIDHCTDASVLAWAMSEAGTFGDRI